MRGRLVNNIGMDLEESGRGLLESLFRTFPRETEENH
jgi:hypothetical protein